MDEELLNQELPVESTPETAAETDVPVAEDQAGDESIKKYFPTTEITDANRSELSSAATALEELETIKPKYEKLLTNNRELIAFFNANPEAASAMSDALKGEDFWMAAAKYVDLASIAPIEGEPDFEKWNQNKEARMSKLSEKENWDKEIAENESSSIDALKQFKAEHQMEDEDFDKFWSYMEPIITAVMRKKLTAELLESIYYRMNRDGELANAKEEGRTEMANTRISDFMDKDETAQVGDGMPDMSQSSASVNQTPVKKEESFAGKFFKDVFN